MSPREQSGQLPLHKEAFRLIVPTFSWGSWAFPPQVSTDASGGCLDIMLNSKSFEKNVFI